MPRRSILVSEEDWATIAEASTLGGRCKPNPSVMACGILATWAKEARASVLEAQREQERAA